MAEEHGCEAPEGHILCANNCGFFGSPTTLNFCSKCYHEVYLKGSQQQQSQQKPFSKPVLVFPEPVKIEQKPVVLEVIEPVPVQPNRCSVCRKKVGLTGFKCRCGTTFCGTHRYPEIHGCPFDFKSMGREAIAKANPLIKAEKLDKI
ncbi:zinc finger A20 and AN1 domain-containing stress-associated protein 4 [Lycium ferocissimum]|uniref:zinc finger A20 and AN1 domain-containing stress-associated protein 4 n=1 Tax=Lycium ferocissimum TaxID=112874 RepID=UPI00281567A8|nr:zinc finger A20 and AN1 domain-containing stress-associated protein 4 [Lycium ferocissimum]